MTLSAWLHWWEVSLSSKIIGGDLCADTAHVQLSEKMRENNCNGMNVINVEKALRSGKQIGLSSA